MSSGCRRPGRTASPGPTAGPSRIVSPARSRLTPRQYEDAVRAVVASIPPGRVMSYGSIAAYLAEATGRASPRLIGGIMARRGDGLPWHRVVRSDGRPARSHEARALRRLRDDGTPMRGVPGLRVDMTTAAWSPERPPG